MASYNYNAPHVGDIKVEGDQVLVYQNNSWDQMAEPESQIDIVRRTVDEFHKDKKLPSYDKLMEMFFEAYPEYKL